MAALDEILRLEHQIHDLTKDIARRKSDLVKCETNIQKSLDLIDAAKAKHTLHRGNQQHMQRVADHVDIKEWAQTQQHLENARGDLAEGELARALCIRARARLQREVCVDEAAIKRAKALLSRYGRLERFPEKKYPA